MPHEPYAARRPSVLLATLMIGAGAPQDARTWTVDERPAVSIGAAGTDTLIIRSLSAVRLSSGTIVVASNRTSQLEWFDAAGTHFRTTGRRGGGPGEFGGAIYLTAGPGDTLIARDDRNRRYNYYAPSGQFLRTDTLGDRRRAIWVYDRTVVSRAPASVTFERLSHTLERIPFSGRDSARSARVAANGNVWITASVSPLTYAIYAPDARPLGTITLPPRFEPYQILDTLVLGHATDEEGFERIQLLRIAPPRPPVSPGAAGSARRPYDAAGELTNRAAAADLMRDALRAVFNAQESYFERNGRYALNLRDLSRDLVPSDIGMVMIDVQRNHYTLVASHRSTRVACVIALGTVSRLGELILCG